MVAAERKVCKHLEVWKKGQGRSTAFRPVQTCLHALWSRQGDDGGAETPSAVCLHCGQASQTVLQHKADHAHRATQGHHLVLDVLHAELYCSSCQDYIYEADFDQAVTAARIAATGHEAARDLATGPVRQEGLISGAQSASRDEGLLQQYSRDIPSDAASAPGLRGLTNLGNTCFMSSVLQACSLSGAAMAATAYLPIRSLHDDVLWHGLVALLHAPQMRNFYLSGGHTHLQCTKGTSTCLPCQLDVLFSAAYSGERDPLRPSSFLHAWWRQAEHNLAGYQQQDAHEFYLSALSGLDMVSRPATPSSRSSSPPGGAAAPYIAMPNGWQEAAQGLQPSQASASEQAPESRSTPEPGPSSQGCVPEGIVRQSFGGLLQSDVICSHCGHVSTAFDPFLDISLDIEPLRKQPPLPAKRTPPPSSQKSGKRLSGAAARAKDVKAAKAAAAAAATSKGSASDLQRQAGRSTAGTATPSPEGTPTPSSTVEVSIVTDHWPGPSHTGASSASCSILGTATGTRDQTATSPRRPFVSDLDIGQSQGSMASPPFKLTPDASMRSNHDTLLAVPAFRRASSPSQASVLSGSHMTGTSLTPSQTDMPATQNSIDTPHSRTPAAARSSLTPRHDSSPSKLPSSPGSSKKPRPIRCGQCHTCRTPSLKKGCMRNQQLRSQGLDPAVMSAEELSAVPVPQGEHVRQAGSAPIKPSGADMASIGCPAALSNGAPALGAQQWPGALSNGGAGEVRPPVHPASMPRVSAKAQPQSKPLTRPPLPVGGPPPDQTPASSTVTGSTAACIRVPVPPDDPAQKPPLTIYRPHGAATLLGCLQRFVRPERLGDAGQWSCDRCKTHRTAVKQMSVRQLPPVLCLHLKRFEHTLKAQGRKIDTPLLYPSHLSMRAFLATSVLRKRYAARPGAAQSQPRGRGRPKMQRTVSLPTAAHVNTVYELYAVVVHMGHLQGGHYIAYIKCGEQWYLCDDAVVTAVDAAVAHSPQAYMLFYRHKTQFTQL